MNNTIQTIIEMDKTARERVRRAEEEAAQITAQTEKKLANLMQNAKAQSEAEVNAARAEIISKSDMEIAELKENADKKCRRLSSVMEKGSDDMCREIVERIFRGEA